VSSTTKFLLTILAVIGAIGWGYFQKVLVTDKKLPPLSFSVITPFIAAVLILAFIMAFHRQTISGFIKLISDDPKSTIFLLVYSGVALGFLYISFATLLKFQELSQLYPFYISLTLIAIPIVDRFIRGVNVSWNKWLAVVIMLIATIIMHIKK